MKKLIFISLFLFCNRISYAQSDSLKRFYWGAKVLVSKSYFYGQSNLTSVSGGAVASYKYSKKNNAYLDVGLLYSERNLISSSPLGSGCCDLPYYGLKYNYLELPIQIRYELLGNWNYKIQPVINTGLMPALLISGLSIRGGIGYAEYRYSIFKGYPNLYTKMDISLLEGIGANIYIKKHLLYIGLQAQYGLIELASKEILLHNSDYYWGKRFYNAHSIVFAFYY